MPQRNASLPFFIDPFFSMSASEPTSHKSGQLLSRSALAEKLGVPLKKVTGLLLDAGWIRQTDEGWELTKKGEFEGGQRKQSQKFGEYIVFPVSVLEHRIFASQISSMVSATELGKQLDLPARIINSVLMHAQLQVHHHKGWRLTEFGKKQGGHNHENPKTGVPWNTWPVSILKLPALQAILDSLKSSEIKFSEKVRKENLMALNGMSALHQDDQALINWCYLMGVTISRNVCLPEIKPFPTVWGEGDCYCDYWIPKAGLFIDVWSETLTPHAISAQLSREAYCNENNIDRIELKGPLTVKQLTDVLPKAFLQRSYVLD
ncbi:hypothetical protein [Marinibactrum halimedae]|uniref:Uncharacterized protein n=1 Tax=Marinibactrum halimedae TaxID=1444977 RepID=A0AA37TDU9_9GAMM|nr:hypothetical protein [Marinibactrum halimedae]MCD9459253.1 hypothetical protein [Marinibactrum halimedae]GLS27327.1 hypothetical protein GCM10007877_30460 [Marinibactrum halimedae]